VFSDKENEKRSSEILADRELFWGKRSFIKIVLDFIDYVHVSEIGGMLHRLRGMDAPELNVFVAVTDNISNFSLNSIHMQQAHYFRDRIYYILKKVNRRPEGGGFV